MMEEAMEYLEKRRVCLFWHVDLCYVFADIFTLILVKFIFVIYNHFSHKHSGNDKYIIQ